MASIALTPRRRRLPAVVAVLLASMTLALAPPAATAAAFPGRASESGSGSASPAGPAGTAAGFPGYASGSGSGSASPAGPAATAAAFPHATTESVGGIAGSVARAWIPKVTDSGAVIDPLPVRPRPFPDGYGELMLAAVLAGEAQRTGDHAPGVAAERIVRARIGKRPAPTDPFTLLAAVDLHAVLAAGAVPGFTLTTDFANWLAAYRPFRYDGKNGGACLARRGCYTNWRLVWAAAAAGLLKAADTVGAPLTAPPEGSLLADPAATRRQIRSNLTLALRHRGPAVRTPLGTARVLSDPAGQPTAYHVFSAYLLERIAADAPSLMTPAANRLRDQVSRFAMVLMTPDGQLAWSGRSMDQSWVLAAAAALGARRAALAKQPVASDAMAGEATAAATTSSAATATSTTPLAARSTLLTAEHSAARWRTFADRALIRLQRAHEPFADGTLPVVPGLRTRTSRAILDRYAGVVQYNGLTALLLADAAVRWPHPTAARASLPADSVLLAVDRTGSQLAWGRSGRVAWGIGLSTLTPADRRSAPGLAFAARQTADGDWQPLVALRTERGAATTWKLIRRGVDANLQVRSVTGSGRRAIVHGYWVARGRRVRVARFELTVRGARLQVSTRLARGERLAIPAYLPRRTARLRARGPGARVVRARRCTVSASGRACPARADFAGRGTARVRIG